MDNLNLLIVEDDSLYLEKLKRRFGETTSWNVLGARNASECVSIMSGKTDIHVLIVDVMMPRGERAEVPLCNKNQHGLVAAKLIRTSNPATCVIGMSVDIDEEAKLWFRTQGQGFILKENLRPKRFAKTVEKIVAIQSEFASLHLSPNPEKPQRLSINARMLETVQRRPEACDWTIRQWTEHLECSNSSVQTTKTWGNLMLQRGLAKEQAVERHRRREE